MVLILSFIRRLILFYLPLSGGVGFPSGSFCPSGLPSGPTGVTTFPSGPFGGFPSGPFGTVAGGELPGGAGSKD